MWDVPAIAHVPNGVIEPRRRGCRELFPKGDRSMQHKTGSREQWLAARLERSRRRKSSRGAATSWRGGARSCRGSGSTSSTNSRPMRETPRWPTSSKGIAAPRLPHLTYARGLRRPLGQVPVARPRPEGAQRRRASGGTATTNTSSRPENAARVATRRRTHDRPTTSATVSCHSRYGRASGRRAFGRSWSGASSIRKAWGSLRRCRRKRPQSAGKGGSEGRKWHCQPAVRSV